MYEEYLFLSTNLKAKFPKFIDKAQWEWLKNANLTDLLDWLKETSYAFISEIGYQEIVRILTEDLKLISKTVKSPYIEIMLFDLMVHDVRNLIEGIEISGKREVFYGLPYSPYFGDLKKEILNRLTKIWQETKDLRMLNLFVDVAALNLSKEFLEDLESEKVKNFWKLRNNLYLIKVLLRIKKINISPEILKKIDLPKTDPEELVNSLGKPYIEFLKEVENEDIDLLIKKYLFNFMRKNFKNVVSGPEVVLYYFYNKLWEMEDLLTLIESKRNKIPNQIWEKGLLKIND
ncbi:MAG TPA: V-type ATPase subunit [Dictyoglomaceae bacterium]|nr:V-type ATPase subunit [Dictyoglomaceae bacterium]HOL39144.1 V-type ATPase subunit [Dictyoglomaceae bacterium]HOP94247.1 V-type ATPase subunit [Dictyoglomaceae bacterium]HPP15298.1 V-type ATPase subunit [Dictyoglomaceae bacterium]HPU42704.1 V-type ATPase subunit [Dictyoglomaceae bacterium]